MPALKDIKEYIERIAPPALAKEWDNVGLLISGGQTSVRHILVVLDITPAVAEEAARLGCELIVAHHPVIFHPLKTLRHTDAAYILARAGISALCAHTNWDAAAGGVNDVLAAMLGLQNPQPLDFGRIGDLPGAMPPEAFAAHCQNAVGRRVQFATGTRPVKKVVVAGGGGGDLLPFALDAGADALFTGEAGHHDALDAAAAGLTLVLGGHYATEQPSMAVLAGKLRAQFKDLQVTQSLCEADPLRFL